MLRGRRGSDPTGPQPQGPALGAASAVPGGVAPPSPATPRVGLARAHRLSEALQEFGVHGVIEGPAHRAGARAIARATVPQVTLAPHATPGSEPNWL